MIFTAAGALLLLLCPTGNSEVDLSPIAATCSAATVVQVFKSAVFIDMVSSHDPEVVFGLQLSSAAAAERFYSVTLRLFQAYGFSNAVSIASAIKDAVSQADPFTLSVYYTTGDSMGKFLAEEGHLDCENVIARATQFYEGEQREFQYLDPSQLESYVQAAIVSFGDLLESLGYTTEENEQNWQRVNDWFYVGFKNYASLII